MRQRPSVKYLGIHAPRPYRLDLPKNDREMQVIYLTADERDALVEALYAPSRSYVDDGGALPVPSRNDFVFDPYTGPRSDR